MEDTKAWTAIIKSLNLTGSGLKPKSEYRTTMTSACHFVPSFYLEGLLFCWRRSPRLSTRCFKPSFPNNDGLFGSLRLPLQKLEPSVDTLMYVDGSSNHTELFILPPNLRM